MSVPEAPRTTILDLPVDLLFSIFPYLDAASFLNLTATCSALHKLDFINDSAFWSSRVRHDFRVPNRPVIQQDGQHWRKLYERLRTQAKVFTWGNNEHGCLGHSFGNHAQLSTIGRAGRRVHPQRRSNHIRSPGEMDGTAELGVISDLQCGGWSTTLLTSKGALYTVGVLNSEQILVGQPPYNRQRRVTVPTPLAYPPGLTPPQDRHDPAKAIKQFSSGRSHVLGLSDSGRIWTWSDISKPALNVQFLHHTTKEDGSERGMGAVKKVVAGWSKSAALIEGSGIVLWDPLELDTREMDVSDAALVMESVAVPRTAHIDALQHKSAPTDHDQTENIGEVKNFIILENCLLFNTSLGKVFACQLPRDDNRSSISEPIALTIPGLQESGVEDSTFVTDVQGSFRSFAVFTRSGAVLTSDQDRLVPILTNPSSQQRLFQRIPALQNKQVISLAFGDYHFHALHSPGYITSYGTEPQACGALGLGGHGVPEGRLRGIRNQGVGADGRLVPHAYTEGRRVWFEKEKGEWITFMTSGGVDHEEAAERVRLAIGSPGIDAQGEVSEWIEQEGRDWERKFNIKMEGEDDGLGAYFALSVSAAGWHSGALVLVNEQMAERLRKAIEIPDASMTELSFRAEDDSSRTVPMRPQTPTHGHENTSFWDRAADWGRYFLGLAPYNVSDASYDPNASHLRPNVIENTQHRNPRPLSYGASPREGFHYIWADNHFPRLKLRDGTEMPGQVPFDTWRYGRPDWKLDWDSFESVDDDLQN